MTEYIVEMKHITKRFPGIVANDDVSLSIKKKRNFCIARGKRCRKINLNEYLKWAL